MTEDVRTAGTTLTSGSGGPAPTSSAGRSRRRLPPVSLWGGYLVLVAMVAAFSLADPDRFLSAANIRAIMEISALPLCFVVALSLVVIGGEFDLSFAATAALSAAVAAQVMAELDVSWPVAVLAGVCIGVVVGVVNGYAVAYLRIPSFIGTLAVSSVAAGVEIALTDQRQISEGLSSTLSDVVRATPLLGLSSVVWLALVLAVVMVVVTRFTVFGRHLDAVGGNAEAAEIAGIPVARRVFMAFLIAGAIAGTAGVVVIGQAAAYYPDSTAGYLLPAFTAVFVGLAFHPRNQFSVAGSVVGVLLVGVLNNGLIITRQPTWAANVIQGLILLVAVRISLKARSR